MRRLLLYCLAVLLHSLLATTTAWSQLQKIYIHPKAAGNEKQSQFVDSIRFIPLEAKEGIQLGTNNNITITENYYLINDYSGKKLFLFSKTGAFVKAVSYKHLGENFYPGYREHLDQLVFFGQNKNYALTPKDHIQISMDWSNARNKKYYKKYIIDLSDLAFALKKAVPQEYDINPAHNYYDDYFWRGHFTTSPLFTDSLDFEVKLYKNNELVKGFFPYNRINEPRFLYTQGSAVLSKAATPYVGFVTRPYCDTIYKIIKDSLFPVYQLVLPLENSLPASFFSQPFKNKTERDNFVRNNGWVLRQVYDFHENDKFIFLGVQYHMNYESYIYNKQTSTGYKTKNIKSDSSQYNLSLLSGFGIMRRGDRLYKLQKAGDLTAFFEQHKTVPVPIELESFLYSKPHPDALVLVEFKLKN